MRNKITTVSLPPTKQEIMRDIFRRSVGHSPRVHGKIELERLQCYYRDKMLDDKVPGLDIQQWPEAEQIQFQKFEKDSKLK